MYQPCKKESRGQRDGTVGKLPALQATDPGSIPSISQGPPEHMVFTTAFGDIGKFIIITIIIQCTSFYSSEFKLLWSVNDPYEIFPIVPIAIL